MALPQKCDDRERPESYTDRCRGGIECCPARPANRRPADAAGHFRVGSAGQASGADLCQLVASAGGLCVARGIPKVACLHWKGAYSWSVLSPEKDSQGTLHGRAPRSASHGPAARRRVSRADSPARAPPDERAAGRVGLGRGRFAAGWHFHGAGPAAPCGACGGSDPSATG